jgi:Gluconate 2-dehydrogenase subunit 3
VENPKHGTEKMQFDRREMLKILGSVPGAALVSAAPLAGGIVETAPPRAAAAANPSAAYQPKIFNQHDWKTLHLLSDLIMPPDQHTGGAVDAGVPSFIDDWLAYKQGELPAQIQGGLTWLDLECNRLFQHDFADATAAEQKQILERIAYPEKAVPGDANAVAFFNRLRDLVVSGYFTSREGIKALPYLGNEPQSEWNGCPAPVLEKLGLEKAKSKA